MILDLPLPAGWSRSPALTKKGGDSGDLIWPDATAPLPRSGRKGRSLQTDDAGEPALLLVSPFLPLPRSLPILLKQALDSEPDYRIETCSPILTPRLGPWEIVALLTVGKSQESGLTTARIYAALDAGYGAFLLVFMDRQKDRLELRKSQLWQMLAGARLIKDPEVGQKTPSPNGAASSTAVPDHLSDKAPEKLPEKLIDKAAPDLRDSEHPPQRPPAEIFFKEVLYRHLID